MQKKSAKSITPMADIIIFKHSIRAVNSFNFLTTLTSKLRQALYFTVNDINMKSLWFLRQSRHTHHFTGNDYQHLGTGIDYYIAYCEVESRDATPYSFGSVENEYCVLAIHIGK